MQQRAEKNPQLQEFRGGAPLAPPRTVKTEARQARPQRAGQPSYISARTFAFCGIGLLFFYVAAFTFGTFFKFRPIESALLSAILLMAIVAFCNWAVMWGEVFTSSLIIGVFSLLVPVFVYYSLYEAPDRSMKPFLLHIGSIVLCAALVAAFMYTADPRTMLTLQEMFRLLKGPAL